MHQKFMNELQQIYKKKLFANMFSCAETDDGTFSFKNLHFANFREYYRYHLKSLSTGEMIVVSRYKPPSITKFPLIKRRLIITLQYIPADAERDEARREFLDRRGIFHSLH